MIECCDSEAGKTKIKYFQNKFKIGMLNGKFYKNLSFYFIKLELT